MVKDEREIDAAEEELDEYGGAEYDWGNIGGGDIAQEDSGGEVVDDRVAEEDIRC